MKKLAGLWTNSAEALLAVTLLLSILGFFNIFSASSVMAGHDFNDSYFFLKRQVGSFVVGLVVMFICVHKDYHAIRKWSLLLVAVTLAALVAIYFVGISANGARRWLRFFGGMQFQPSELAKLTVVCISAAYLGPRLDRGRLVSLQSSPLVLALVMGGLVYKQPDMGTAAVIVFLCLLMYLLTGISRKAGFMLAVCVGVGVVYMVFAAGYRAERIMAWLHPWEYQGTSGYQIVQSLLAIGSGGLTGTGQGLGASKFFYLPEPHTDFAFSVWCQEMGFIGAAIVLILFTLLTICGLRIARKASDGFGMLLGAGLTILISAQAVGNIAMVAGLVPVTGVPLPFISYGGTSLIVNMVAIGMLISISRYSQCDASRKSERDKPGRQRQLHVMREHTEQ